jgi:hypothetical protein
MFIAGQRSPGVDEDDTVSCLPLENGWFVPAGVGTDASRAGEGCGHAPWQRGAGPQALCVTQGSPRVQARWASSGRAAGTAAGARPWGSVHRQGEGETP